MKKLDILFFGVHPDDVELSAAGTVIKHVKLGFNVGIIDLTQGELGTRGSAKLRLQEAKAAQKIMGVPVRENLKMKDGFFQNDEAHQRKIIQVIRKYQPDIVVANAIHDRHPDHGRAASLVSDACFLSGLIKIKTGTQKAWRPKAVYYYIQDRYIKPDFVVNISEEIEVKMKAIKAYASQFYSSQSKEPKTYISNPGFLDAIKSRSAELGRVTGCEFAEGFTSAKLIGIEKFSDLAY
jgi:bacillithiol biosynthesis deacetylase BshB1